jgi:hypothetical protein
MLILADFLKKQRPSLITQFFAKKSEECILVNQTFLITQLCLKMISGLTLSYNHYIIRHLAENNHSRHGVTGTKNEI